MHFDESTQTAFALHKFSKRSEVETPDDFLHSEPRLTTSFPTLSFPPVTSQALSLPFHPTLILPTLTLTLPLTLTLC